MLSTRSASLLLTALLLGSLACGGNRAPQTQSEDQLAFGVNMAQRGLWNEALFRFQQADKLNPNNAQIYNNMAVASEALGLFDEALEHYRQALKLDPGNPELKRNYVRFSEFYQSYAAGNALERSASSADGESDNGDG